MTFPRRKAHYVENLNTLSVPTQWTLEMALVVIRALQQETRQFHYHLCLGGGVMNNGRSEKDLDLYFLPLGDGEPDLAGIQRWLDEMWGKGEDLGEYNNVAPYVYRRKYKYGEQRIDVFVLGAGENIPQAQEAENPWTRYINNTPLAQFTTGTTNGIGVPF